jgi:hypothetical protein
LLEALKVLINWLVPPVDHDELTQYLWRVRIAFFGCLSFALVTYIAGAMLFELGPEVIRPASAQAVQKSVQAVKTDVNAQMNQVQGKLDVLASTQRADRLERLDQQLLWYRGQNCKAHTASAKQLFLSKLQELAERYQSITGLPYQMPSCADLDGAGG